MPAHVLGEGLNLAVLGAEHGRVGAPGRPVDQAPPVQLLAHRDDLTRLDLEVGFDSRQRE